MPKHDINRSRILLIEDDTILAGTLVRLFAKNQYDVSNVTNGEEALELINSEKVDLVLTDINLPGLNGIQLLEMIKERNCNLPVIVMTGNGTLDTAVNSMKHGAYDYLLKPYDTNKLLAVTEKAIAAHRLANRKVNLHENAEIRNEECIIGQDQAMQEVYKHIGRLANKKIPVLIHGETGTGKELVASALYRYSDRAGKRFIAINCSAIPENLLESELFGHVKGSFTGANQDRIGRFEQADGGVLFLDEIGDLSYKLQSKLLRVLQEECIEPVGSKSSKNIDVRLIFATHRNLAEMVKNSEFREDLLHRLNSMTITLPPLRKRKSDIALLARYFIEKYSKEYGYENSGLNQQALNLLESRSWPGNVRELVNTIRRALVLSQGYPLDESIIMSALSDNDAMEIAQYSSPDIQPNKQRPDFIGAIRKSLIEAQNGEKENVYEELLQLFDHELLSEALKRSHYNLSLASKWLGISRPTLTKKIKALGLMEKELVD